MGAKHTATPWSVAGTNSEGWLRISQQEDLPVAHVRSSIDAEFIIRACNAHDDLVKSMTELKEAIEFTPLGVRALYALEKARVALDKAKGQ
jgi:hypothetical protein